MDDNELEYRLPAKVLTNRDPILMNRLSIREFIQWLFFFALIYLGFNLIPFDFYVRMVVAACIAMFAFLFIHAPINGLGGIEWLYIWLRYRLEKKRHQTQPPANLTLVTSRHPTIEVTMSVPVPKQGQNQPNETQAQGQEEGQNQEESQNQNQTQDQEQEEN